MSIPDFVRYREENHLPFDLYFAGSYSCDDEMIRLKTNRLQSQLNDKTNILKLIDKGFAGKLFIDSGAFSAHTKGKIVDVDKYIDFLNEIDDKVYICAQVDTIPGEFKKPKTEQQLKEAPKLSWENYLYMKDKVKNKDKLLPIYHQGEDEYWLKNMLEYTENGQHIPYIGISPANDLSNDKKEIFIKKCFNIISKSSHPNVKTHAFGMTKLQFLEKYPFYSADSTTWHMQGIYGGLFTPYGFMQFSTRSKTHARAKAHNRNLTTEQKNNIIKWLNKWGLTLEMVEESDINRMKANLYFFYEWSQNYKFKGNDIYTHKLF